MFQFRDGETRKIARYLGARAWTSPSAHGPPFPAANKKLGKCSVFHGRSFPYSRLHQVHGMIVLGKLS